MIGKCTCKHEYQDQKHGKGNRVFNKTMKNDYRCTICEKSLKLETTKETKNETSK